MIGINTEGKIKIWVNQNFGSNSVQMPNFNSKKNKKDNILTTFELVTSKVSRSNLINQIKTLFFNEEQLDYFGAVTIIENIVMQNNIRINSSINIEKHFTTYNNVHNYPNQIPINTLKLHQSLKPIHTQMSPHHIPIHKSSPYQTTLIYQHSGPIPQPTVLFNSQHKPFTNLPMRVIL